ncbi:FAD-dependent oxidoreductase [Streptomyces sp. Caat 7-52]|uniref:NAD(P)/FAD-dependent oxidoreductase n=1 Tax=Streptomyces sp. Caat 7-52 TaxID=2949637 RepID=UPI002035C79A|nr:FAD-dependent oxidoreductase [Streptomyces sp. Caat 7-52]
MPTAVVTGGSVAGLAAALALNRLDLTVLVLDRAPAPPDGPLGEAVDRWQHRPTVPQTHHSHTLTSLGVRLLRTHAPGILAEAQAAGAPLLRLTEALPASGTDSTPRPGDDDLVGLGCRRATLELLLYRAVRELPGVTVRHGTTVTGLELDRRTPRVRAVVTTDGERIPADLVLDATGRRAQSRVWLANAGIPVARDLTSPSEMTGHTRFYRLRTATRPGPLNRGNAAGDIFAHYAGVLHLGDQGTFSIALGTLPGDRALQALRTPAGFTAAARATPGLAPWLDDAVSTPLSPVRAMTFPANTLRGVAGPLQEPVAGLFSVGDAACVTDPLFGRGISLALDHAFRLADLLAGMPDITVEQRRAAARMTHELFTPWYEHSVAADRTRTARWRAAVEGVEPPPAPPPAPDGRPGAEQVAAAARTDGTVWRGMTRMLMTLTTPAELFGDAGFLDRVRRAPAPDPAHPAGPSRADLVRCVSAAEGAPV